MLRAAAAAVAPSTPNKTSNMPRTAPSPQGDTERVRAGRAAAAALAPPTPNRTSIIARTASAPHGGTERAQKARETSVVRGPSRVSAQTTRERIRTVVVEDHGGIALLVAQRIATLIR